MLGCHHLKPVTRSHSSVTEKERFVSRFSRCFVKQVVGRIVDVSKDSSIFVQDQNTP